MKPIILVIGDRLSEEEFTLQSGPFSGPYSYKFKRNLDAFTPIYVNLSQTKTKAANGSTLSAQIIAEIKRVAPAGILACGRQVGEVLGLITDNALAAFDNCECHRYEVLGIPTVLIVHPREDMLDTYYPQHIQFGINKLRRAVGGYKEPPFTSTHNNIDTVLKAAQALSSATAVCFDIETPMLKSRSDLYLRSIAWTTDGQTAYSISPDQYSPAVFEEVMAHILAAITNPAILKINQNIFFDLSVLNQIYGVFVKGPVHCTMQVENLVAHQFPKSLNDLAKRYLDIGPWKGGHKASGHELREYNCHDVIYTYRIYEKQVASMKALNLYPYWNTYRKDLFEATFHMAMTGMLVDTELRTKYQAKVKDALIEPIELFSQTVKPFIAIMPPKESTADVWDKPNDVLVPNVPLTAEQVKSLKGDSWKAHLYACGINKDIAPDYYIVKKKAAADFGWTVGEVRRKLYRSQSTFTPYIEINPNSPVQLKLLFAAMDIPKVRTRNAVTKKYVTDSTSSDALRKILATKPTTEAQSNVLIALLNYRELSKVLQTYYCMELDPDNVWRYTYNQDGADTGRSTSATTSWGTGGNSQNLPSRTKNAVLKKLKFKNLIVPRPGRVFFTPDQASAESVIVAYLSNCRIMMEEFAKPEPDFHRMVAKLCYEYLSPGKNFDDLDKTTQKQLRNDSKAISHGCVTAGHEYLTPDGWKPIEQYVEGESIAVWDQGTNGISFEVPGYVQTVAKEALLNLEGTSLSMIATPDHRMPIRKWANGVATVSTLKPVMGIPRVGIYRGKELDRDLRPIAAIQADGSVNPSGYIRFHVRKERKRERLKELFPSLLPHTCANGDFSCGISVEEWFKFRPYLTPVTKDFNLPALLDVALPRRLEFLDELVKWDGHRNYYVTTNKHNAEVVQTLAQLSGRGALVRMSKRPGRKDLYKVHFNKRTHISAECLTIAEVPNSVGTPVYCFTTSTGFFLMRRRGECFISGNSSYGMFVDTLRESYFKATGKFRSREDIEGLLIAWHKAFEEIKMNWHALIRARIDSGEAWTNCFGRRYYFSGVRDFNSVQEMLAKEPQGLVPDITNIMVQWSYQHLVVETGHGVVVQHGHDAFLCEVDVGYVEEFAKRFFDRAAEITLEFPTGRVTMKWDGQIGTRWGRTRKWSRWVRKYNGLVRKQRYVP